MAGGMMLKSCLAVLAMGCMVGCAVGLNLNSEMRTISFNANIEQADMEAGRMEFHSMLRRTAEIGMMTPAERIVNGDKATSDSQFPQVVALVLVRGSQSQIFCTGSVVDDSLVLTAAHCLDSLPAGSSVLACAGTIDLDTDSEICRTVVEANIPTLYDPLVTVSGWDIGLVKTSEAIKVEGIETVKLASRTPVDRTVVISVGYGLQGGSVIDNSLNFVDTQVVANDRCIVLAINGNSIDTNLLCTNANYDGSLGSVCSGDSGGPLLVSGSSETFQAGIASSSPVIGGECVNRLETVYMSTYSPGHKQWLEFAASAMDGSVTYTSEVDRINIAPVERNSGASTPAQ